MTTPDEPTYDTDRGGDIRQQEALTASARDLAVHLESEIARLEAALRECGALAYSGQPWKIQAVLKRALEGEDS